MVKVVDNLLPELYLKKLNHLLLGNSNIEKPTIGIVGFFKNKTKYNLKLKRIFIFFDNLSSDTSPQVNDIRVILVFCVLL